MSKVGIVRGVKVVSAVAVGVLLATSVGSAAASPSPVTSDPLAAQAVDALSEVTPASWRESAANRRAGVVRPASRPTRAVQARRAQAAAFAKYADYTLSSRATKDMRGVEKSLYRGKYYRPAAEQKRLCVVKRESEGHYDVVSPSGAYFGAYQVSRELARGATWMMLKEHKKLMGDKAAKRVLTRLRSKPMNTWPRYWQDAAFHTVINWDHTLAGASHWAGGRWHC